MRTIAIIAAMANNRVIGNENHLPWHLPADLRHFKEITINKPIIMGRKTFESLGRPLPQRQNIVVTRNKKIFFSGCDIAASLKQAIEIAGDVPEVMICGGAKIYEQALPIADRMYLTFVDTDPAGDTFFPEWDHTKWQEISSEQFSPDEKNPFTYRFVVLERKM